MNELCKQVFYYMRALALVHSADDDYEPIQGLRCRPSTRPDTLDLTRSRHNVTRMGSLKNHSGFIIINVPGGNSDAYSFVPACSYVQSGTTP